MDVKEAVDTAAAYFSKLMPVKDVRLEEVEIADDERFWKITLSGLVPAQRVPEWEAQATMSPLANFFKVDFDKVIRVFTIDSSNGDVRSMKIRKGE